MFKTLVNAWKVMELRKKIIYTLLIILLYRIGSAIPVPFVDIVKGGLETGGGTMLTYLSMMNGSAFNYGTLFAMSITPYINAQIIMQLLAVAIPALEKLEKEGEEGRKKINKYTRYMAVVLGFFQSAAYYFFLKNTENNGANYLMKDANGHNFTGLYAIFQAIVIITVFTAGSALIMWLGEQINDKGVGNGISLILFANIISRGPTMGAQIWDRFQKGGVYSILAIIAIIFFLAIVAFIVWMDNSERRIPIQYAKRVVGRKMYGGQNTHIPIKVNMSGVMPVIFASSILSLPGTIQLFIKNPSKNLKTFFELFTMSSWFYGVFYFLFIIFFAYFYATIQYNPIEMANNLRKSNGGIPGIRPGKPTSDYIKKILSRITLLGALLLSVVAVLPLVLSQILTKVKYPMDISLGGTSIIIMVGVALETVKQLESQMMMRHYKGFLD